MTVNHDVTGASPVGGAKKNPIDMPKTAYLWGFSLPWVLFDVTLRNVQEIA